MERKLTSFILFAAAMVILISPLGYLSILGLLILFIASDKTGELVDSFARNKPFLLFIISLLLSVLFSNVPESSVLFFILVILQCSHYSMVFYYSRYRGTVRLFNALNHIAVITSAYGIYQFMTGKLEINKHWTGYMHSLPSLTRIYSTLYNPNIFAAYLVINICFIISWVLNVKPEKNKSISLILCSVSLLLTYSRGAFVSLIAALIIIYVVKRDKKVLLYGAIMLVLFLLFNNGIGHERIDIVRINNDSSSRYRLEIWRTSYQIFLQNPITGNGIGTLWYSLSHVSSRLWGVVYHAHNIYLHFAAETGVLGLLAFMNVLVRLFKSSYQAMRNSCHNLERFAALGAIGSCTAVMIHGLIDASIVVPTMSLVIMNYYGLCSFELCNKQAGD